MSAPGLDVREHSTVIKALLDARLSPNRTYSYGEVPGMDGNAGTVPSIYAVLSVERAHVPVNRMSGRASRSMWRASVAWVGRTEPEARWAESRVAQALEGARITAGGERSTPLQHNTSTGASYDDGRMSGVTTYRYAL